MKYRLRKKLFKRDLVKSIESRIQIIKDSPDKIMLVYIPFHSVQLVKICCKVLDNFNKKYGHNIHWIVFPDNVHVKEVSVDYLDNIIRICEELKATKTVEETKKGKTE